MTSLRPSAKHLPNREMREQKVNFNLKQGQGWDYAKVPINSDLSIMQLYCAMFAVQYFLA